MERRKKRWILFSSMLTISAFTFGGGFVIISLMKKKFADALGWFTEEEMLDMTALAQATPGAIAVNAAILVGWRAAGFGGMLAAVLGTLIPPMTILSAVSVFYAAFAANPYLALFFRGLQAGVAAVITDVVLTLAVHVVKEKRLLPICLMAAAFTAACILKVNVMLILLAAVLFGGITLLVNHRRRAKE